MCEANAYLIREGTQEKLLENVDTLDIVGEEIRLVNIFGEQKVLRARLRLYDGANRKIFLEPVS